MEPQGEEATQQTVQRYRVTKPTKTEERDIVPSESRYDAHLELPDPSKLRNAAGGVTRRTDRVERAEPPPNPTRTATNPRKKEQPHRRRKGGAGFGGDSGSDSDDDKPKRNRDDDGSKPTSRRRLPQRKPVDVPDSSAFQLNAEEQDRLQQLRALRNVKEKWTALDEQRQHCRYNYKARTICLARDMQGGLFQSPQIFKGVIDRDMRLREYLDEMLYGAITEMPDGNSPTQLTDLEEIVEQVEKRMIVPCSRFDSWKFAGKPWGERLVLVLEALEKAFWNDLSSFWWIAMDDECSEQEWYRRVTQRCSAFMFRTCPPKSSTVNTRRTFIDTLLSQFEENIVRAMIGAVPYPISHSRLQRGPKGTKWLDRFRESRVDGRLAPSYIEWVTAGADLDQLKRFCVEWHAVKREEALREFRESMKMVKMKVEQVFCPDIIQPGVVSVVLIKGDHLATVKDVSAYDLASLGWFHESVDGQHRYWRCGLANYDSWDVARDIYKVGMDGEFLGAFVCVDSSWALLEYDEDNEGAFYRPLNAVEEMALDIPMSGSRA